MANMLIIFHLMSIFTNTKKIKRSLTMDDRTEDTWNKEIA